MNLVTIFQVLEHLNDVEKNGYGGHFVFCKIWQNISQVTHLQARTFHGLSLYSKAIAPIKREK